MIGSRSLKKEKYDGTRILKLEIVQQKKSKLFYFYGSQTHKHDRITWIEKKNMIQAGNRPTKKLQIIVFMFRRQGKKLNIGFYFSMFINMLICVFLASGKPIIKKKYF